MNYYLHDDPNLPAAWAPWFSHEYIAYFSAQAIDRLMSLPPVAVKPNPRYGDKLWPIGPKHIDLYKESYQEHRQLDPLWSFDYKKRNGDFALDPPSGKTIEPWKVLVIYSTEPDLYPDCDLKLHKNQKITGGSHGWRHMQFKLLGTTYGIAPQSFRVTEIWQNLLLKTAMIIGAGAIFHAAAHYLADLGHPFHVKALPGSFLMRKIFARHELFKIFPPCIRVMKSMSNAAFAKALSLSSRPCCRVRVKGRARPGMCRLNCRHYIKQAEKRHNPIFYYFLDQFGKELLDAFAQMDQKVQLDAATQTNRCSADAARVIFKETNLSKLDFHGYDHRQYSV